MAAVGREAEIVALDDDRYPPRGGITPWSVPKPFTFADDAARELGYAPVAGYAAAVQPACEWLVEAAVGRGDWRALFPGLAAYPIDLFDYAAEDALLAERAAPR